MNSRPRSITVISWLFIAVGVIALLYHLLPHHMPAGNEQRTIEPDIVWVCLVRALAILCGVFMLCGFDWARWLLVVWIAYHVILSAFHSLTEVAVHSLLFAVIVYFLFRPQASAYFRRRKVERPQIPELGAR
jgi:hypothetical protein